MQTDNSTLTPEELYERLNILDTKCSALLQLSAIVLTIGTIPVTSGQIAGFSLILSLVIASIFLISSLLSLSVIWIKWEASMKTLVWRTYAYKISHTLTAIGLAVIAVLIFALLLGRKIS